MDVTAIMEKTVKNTEGVHSRSASPPRTLTLFEAKSQLASPPYKKSTLGRYSLPDYLPFS